jgi:hypothetical protein
MILVKLLKIALPLTTLVLCGCGLMTRHESMETSLTHPKAQALDPTYKWELLKIERAREKKVVVPIAENKAPLFKGQVYALKFTLSF